jgi:CBS domain containing-hemolysin-like protein
MVASPGGLNTVLWGEVTIKLLFNLLSDTVLAGIGAFALLTIVLFIPQANSSRNALRVVARLMPLLNVYQLGLFPIMHVGDAVQAA